MKKLLALLVSVLVAKSAFCGEHKIAVVDMEKVFQNYYKTTLADAELKKQAELFKEYAEKLNESLVKRQDEFKDLRDASQNIAFSDAERESKRIAAQDKYRQMRETEAELKQYNSEKQDQLKKKFEEMRSSILKEIRETIRKKCEPEGYDIVLDSSGKTLNNIPSVIYVKPETDLTEAILSEINAPAAAAKKKESEKNGRK